jgi:hypothetical protein
MKDANLDSSFYSFVGLIAGLMLLCYSGYLGVQAVRYSLAGAKTKGHVVQSHQSSGRSGSNGCSYKFDVAGRQYEGHSNNCSLEVDDPLTVHYLTSNPDVNQHGSVSWGLYQWIVLISGLVCSGFSGMSFFSISRR